MASMRPCSKVPFWTLDMADPEQSQICCAEYMVSRPSRRHSRSERDVAMAAAQQLDVVPCDKTSYHAEHPGLSPLAS